MDSPPLVVYVDVDDTLIRSAGTKHFPVSGMAAHVKALSDAGATLYCWSSGGADYARTIAAELGIAACFVAFLPKPHVLIDDQDVGAWRRLVQVHPMQCGSLSIDAYRRAVLGGPLNVEPGTAHDRGGA